MTDQERTTHDVLNAEHAKIEEEYQDADELPVESISVSAKSRRRVLTFEARSLVYDPAEIVRAGVFVSMDSEGRLSVVGGYVRPEDKAPRGRSRKQDKATEKPTAARKTRRGPTRGHHGRRALRLRRRRGG